jgi:hypothetical protein
LTFINSILFAQNAANNNNINSDLELELNESDIRNLNLNLKWSYSKGVGVQSKPTRFVLLMEIKRLNFSTFLFDYSSPQLIDDETVVKASLMEANRFKFRHEMNYVSSIDCSINCINSTKYSLNNDNQKKFDCNLFYYDPTTKSCVLYEYDFSNESSVNGNETQSKDDELKPAVNKRKKKISLKGTPFSEQEEIFESFKDECDMDEILGDVIGYSKLCRRILDYRNTHVVKINPYIDYRFSLSIRNENGEWTPFLRKEYQYSK